MVEIAGILADRDNLGKKNGSSWLEKKLDMVFGLVVLRWRSCSSLSRLVAIVFST